MPHLGSLRMQAPLRRILDEVRDRLLRVGLRRANEANRATLDPAGRIHARNNRGRLILRGVTLNDAPLNVRDHAGASVEGQARDRRRIVAHRAVHGLHGPRRDHARARHRAVAVQGRALGT